MPRRRFDLRLVPAQIGPKRFHRAKFFRDGHLIQWQGGFHDDLIKPLLRQMQAVQQTKSNLKRFYTGPRNSPHSVNSVEIPLYSDLTPAKMFAE